MAEKKEATAKRRPFNFGNSPMMQDTEQDLEQGFQRIENEEQSGVAADGGTGAPAGGAMEQSAPAVQPMREVTAPTTATNTYQEPTQNINIPIPTSQHTRLKIISATSRQTMKDMVVQAIGLWLDVQEGKKAIGTNQA